MIKILTIESPFLTSLGSHEILARFRKNCILGALLASYNAANVTHPLVSGDKRKIDFRCFSSRIETSFLRVCGLLYVNACNFSYELRVLFFT